MKDRETVENLGQPSTSAMPAEEELKKPRNRHEDVTNRWFGYQKPYPHAPWSTKRYNMNIEGLHEEILDLYHWIKPTSLEANVRRRVFEKVAAAIRERWKEYDVRISMFGSLLTNLFLPSSDIDVLVECAEWGQPTTDILEKTGDSLKSSGLAESISVYKDAFVPIVKMIDRDTRLSLDISFNTVQGVRAAQFYDKVKDEFPVIEPLVLVLKQFLHHRSLNQTFTGGLSSYGLILMLVNFFQIYALPLRRKHAYDEGVNLGELLIRFFEVYSQEFNYVDVAINVSKMRYEKKRRQEGPKAPRSPGCLSVQDPLLSCVYCGGNDVGRSTYNYNRVAVAFAEALQVIIAAITVRDRPRSSIWHSVYSGSLLAKIMPFTEKEIFYRSWLKGFSLSYGEDNVYQMNVLCNTLLSPVLDMKKFEWLRNLPTKVSRPLPIVAPDEANEKKEEKAAALQEEVLAGTSTENTSSSSDTTLTNDVSDGNVTIVEEPLRIPRPPSSSNSSASTAMSLSERENESPPLSIEEKQTFKKPFSEVVAAAPSASSEKFGGSINGNSSRYVNGYHSTAPRHNNNSSRNGYYPYRQKRNSDDRSTERTGSSGYASQGEYQHHPRNHQRHNNQHHRSNGYHPQSNGNSNPSSSAASSTSSLSRGSPTPPLTNEVPPYDYAAATASGIPKHHRKSYGGAPKKPAWTESCRGQEPEDVVQRLLWLSAEFAPKVMTPTSPEN
ncbi:unnamed protein product [Caenorhabditis auriculariae]|uniref:Polynucleotide adenylyltransferase n=1 Tax=Caenorhabditis auriculariae TaxID=2777116 RepID=A0A8S1GYH2_9PELO|nr:unnamed protein product [Caenorhabditis auriculariae]